MNSTYLLVAGLCLVGLATRTIYEVLKHAGRVDTKNPAVFAVVFVAMCVMLTSWPVMGPLDPWPIAVPGAVRGIATGAIAVALALAIGALLQLRGLEGIDHLITTGLFSKLRHPMYTGFVLWIAGWTLRDGAIVSLAIGVVGIASVLYWRWLEEEALYGQYGEAYRAYRRGTWF